MINKTVFDLGVNCADRLRNQSDHGAQIFLRYFNGLSGRVLTIPVNNVMPSLHRATERGNRFRGKVHSEHALIDPFRSLYVVKDGLL